MDSPARRYMLDGFVDTDSNETDPTHTNWEGLITAARNQCSRMGGTCHS